MTSVFRQLTPAAGQALLTVEQMARADAATIASSITGARLMAAAGNVVYEAIVNRIPPRRTLVLAGPGNNGGDAFIVAEKLRCAGWDVRLAALAPRESLKGDAAWAASLYKGAFAPLRSGADLGDAALVIDGLFGAGLARPLEGAAQDIVRAINERRIECVAIDVPSGIHGNSGQVLGVAPRCRLTVTFFRAKPGHLLLPGRTYCGELVVGDIGIGDAVLEEIAPTVFRNGPALWRKALRKPQSQDHKYTRGAVLIVAGAGMTGASRLAAAAARRIGAGLVSILAPDAATGAVLRAGDPGVIVREGALEGALADRRFTAVLLGPGGGVDERMRRNVLLALKRGLPAVLDADALTAFGDQPSALFDAISGLCLLTPHEGEYSRLFNSIELNSDKLAKARKAAALARATVLLKGADTVVAQPDGLAAINDNAPASLATAGSGDVLAGFAAGLMAQGIDPLAAGAAAAWLHGETARQVGRGLIAEDLVTDFAHMPL